MPQDIPPAISVVSSGNVYRQLFDAQFQLHQSLSQYESEPPLHTVKKAYSKNLPLIRLNEEDTQHGILNKQQKKWVEGLSNDPYTENPVVYKQYCDYVKQRLQYPKTLQSRREVKGLPDIVVSAKKDSDIIERVTESKKQRHESAVEDMHQALALISTEAEPLFEDINIALLAKLAVSDEEIANILASIESDENFLTHQLSDLNAFWEKIQAHTPQRYICINKMNSEHKKIESKRMDKIREIFKEYGSTLHNISYLMLPDLQRFMDKESQMINQTILSNHRSFADLYMRLMSAEAQRERIQHATFQRRVEDWKQINTRIYVESFRDFMKMEAVVQPPNVEAVKKNLLLDQKNLNDQRIKLISSLCDMQPPNSNQSSIYSWRDYVNNLSQELDSIMQAHMSKLHEEYELVCQLCLEKVDSLKLTMIETGVCSSHKANQVIDEFMLPLVGKQQKEFEHNLETMQSLTEAQSAKMEEEIAALLKYALGAAEVWDRHEDGMAKREKNLQETLENFKQQHDQNIQEMEANLDIIMDKMRQDANEVTLKESLVKVLTKLEIIKEFHEEFHKRQTQMAQTYPMMVKKELRAYDLAICDYFMVSRVSQMDVAELELEQDFIDEVENPIDRLEKSLSNVINPKVTEAGATAQVQKFPSQIKEPVHASVHKISSQNKETLRTPMQEISSQIKEILCTSKGTEYYLLHETDERNNEDEKDKEKVEGKTPNIEQAFLTEVKTQEISMVNSETDFPDFIQNVHIPRSLISEVKSVIRMNFLDHLDDWNEQAATRANSVVVAKCEELNSELDLKLHLHHPRPLRAELDVHNVRAAELVMHAERITRHCTGVDQSLKELRNRFKNMMQEQSKLALTFKDDIQALENIFVNATKSVRLLKLQNQLRTELDKFMSLIRTSLRQFRQHLDESLQTLRESNARFIKSFRIFSDGGNFCPEEVVMYRKKLEKMSLAIDSAEGSIMSELEGMESKHLDSGNKIVVEFEDRFKHHMADLIFMENVTRWLTNTQVKIKAEVANSNTQAKSLVQMLNDLQSRVTPPYKPKSSVEHLPPPQLNEVLSQIFEAFVRRSNYLHCLQASPKTLDSGSAGIAIKAALEASLDKDLKMAIINERKSSRGPYDSTVGVIKKILQCVETSKNKFSLEKGVTGSKELESTAELVLDPTKSEQRNQAGKGIDFSKTPKRLDDVKETAPKSSHSGKISNEIKQVEKDFLSFIQDLLKKALDGLLTTAEEFYTQKGNRPATRPNTMPETNEQFTEVVNQKIQSYYSQAEDYHLQCLHDFHGQLTRLEELSALVPSLRITDLYKEEIQRLEDCQQKISEGFHRKFSELTYIQNTIQKELGPSLGHPNKEAELVRLIAKNTKLHEEYLETVAQHIQEQQDCALDYAAVFLENLAQLAEQQLKQYDGMLVTDEVEKRGDEKRNYQTCYLSRYKKSGKPVAENEEKIVVPRGRSTWLGVPYNQFVIGDKPSNLELSPTIETYKTTLAHFATVKARDKAYQDYKEFFERNLQQLEEVKKSLLTTENSWEKLWGVSVKKVVGLYQDK